MEGLFFPVGSFGFDFPPSGANRTYSPIALTEEWPRINRLLLVTMGMCVGTIMNVFFVTTFFVEHTLNRAGYVFLACTAISDLLITAGVMPASAVVLLSGQWDSVDHCRALQFLTETSTYSYSVFFALVAIENYYRLYRSDDDYDWFISMRIGLVCTSVYTMTTTAAAVGVYLGLDYDYCERRSLGNVFYRQLTSGLFYGIPFIITIFGLFASVIGIARQVRTLIHYRRSDQYYTDRASAAVNITSFIFYVAMWTPYLVIIYLYPGASDPVYYKSAWLGIGRSTFTTFFYALFISNFRRAYARVFNYCCCKSTLTGPQCTRYRRAVEYNVATGDVRVHVLAPHVHATSPQRSASTSASREPSEL
ncbi:uncharacterized protein [Battus philenor]|uniref:uncharacterized protein n=1 Tax=Battus philenor TaxID=42288 RepID=UPI0035CEB833